MSSKLTALPHQTRVSDKVNKPDSPGAIATHGTGSGKTFSSINAAMKAKRNIVAVVPAALRENFRKELKAARFPHEAKVVSYEEARNLQHNPDFHDFAKDSIVVYDEAHRAGVAGSQTSDLPSKIPGAKKLFLTATPIRNHPHELAPLVNALKPGALPSDPKKFMEKFTKDRPVYPGFWAKHFKGAKPGSETVPQNLAEFSKAVKGMVDHYQTSLEHFPSTSEEHIHVDMSPRQQAAYDAIMRKNPGFAYKLSHGVPSGKEDMGKYKQFLIGLRQVSNTPSEFAAKSQDADAPKLERAADEMLKHMEEDKNFRGVAYSNFIGSGTEAYKAALKKRGIKAEVFSGKLKDKDRKDLIKRYNSGKIDTLLISGAGAEGLDLKGTKLMQILEPHWNNARIHQVRGRGVRYKSHAHLPEDERHVHVQHYFSQRPQTAFQKTFGTKKAISADQHLHNLAADKDKLNDHFLKALHTPEKTSQTVANAKRKAITSGNK